MKDTSEVAFWHNDECLCTIPSIKVPDIGEELYINTLSEESWYDTRFKDKKLFQPGVRGKYRVVSIVRSIRSYDVVVTQETEKATYELPGKDYRELFEVSLIKI